MRLFPNGEVRSGEGPERSLILLGNGNRDGTLMSWQLPAFPVEDAELIVECDIEFDGYFAAFPSPAEGHMGFMLRSTIENLATGQYRGHGPIFGSVWRPENNPGGVFPSAARALPCAQLESWGVGVVPPSFEYLRKGSGSPVLSDARFKLFASSKRYGGELYNRYAVSRLNSASQYDPPHDTGDVLDNNWGIDRNRETLTLFDAAGAPKQPYAIRVHNLRARQVPAMCLVPDLRRSE